MIALVGRTPYALTYEVEAAGQVGAVTISYDTLLDDAEGWRDRPIHRLIQAVRPNPERVLLGIGLTSPTTASLLRGSIHLLALEDPCLWSLRISQVDLTVLWHRPTSAPGRSRAILTIGVTR